MINPIHPTPAPPAFGQGKVLPEESASILSRVFFGWLDAFLGVGYTRAIEKEDLWELPPEKRTANVTERVEAAFFSRCPPDQRPRALREKLAYLDDAAPAEDNGDERDEDAETREGSLDDDEKKVHETCVKKTKKSVQKKPKKARKYDSSLVWALYYSFRAQWWYAGFLKLFAETLKTTTPLVTKVLLTWLTEVYVYHRLSDQQREAAAQQGLAAPRGIGYGVGLAFALFVMQEASSLMFNYYMLITMTNGLYIRTGTIGNIFRKSLRLSGRARLEHSVGQITTMISTDASRLDRFSAQVHNLWVAPIQIIIGIGLLIGNLGYSALVGLGVLLLGFPIQFLLVKIMFTQRQKGVKLTDMRVRLATEVLQGIRLVKFFAWEQFYVNQISDLRTREIRTVKKVAVARAGLFSMVFFVPIAASTLSFITYALSGHDLNIALIFSSLQLFNVIRMPLALFPIVLSAFTDAIVALRRIGSFLTAEELHDQFVIDEGAKDAVVVEGDFTWEETGRVEGKFNVAHASAGGEGAKAEKEGKKKGDGTLPLHSGDVKDDVDEKESVPASEEPEKPFELKDLKMRIPKGAFVAIVGRVGSGKSSVLQALIGEMRKTRGEVVFSGKTAYVPQTAWIQNLTLRENVIFGQEGDEERFQEVVKACCLEHDIEMLPQNEHTEIGEKGINLSGGQKARVSLARAAYSHADIVLMDDSLSAVDAYVGKSILENCILSGPLANRTRILVTHALHVLNRTDYIYVMDDGVIVEEGTYKDLMKEGTLLSGIVEEYGNLEEEVLGLDQNKEELGGPDTTDKLALKPTDVVVEKNVTAVTALMQEEERNTGAVEWSVYGRYLRFGGGLIWGPIILGLLIVAQATNVGGSIILGYWTGSGTGAGIRGFTQGDYIAMYAALGIAQAMVTFVLIIALFFMCLSASLALFKSALRGVLRSPVSLFDTTPIGRILSRLSKDQDTLDTELALSAIQFLITFSSILGTVFLVFWTFPLLGIIFAPLLVLYYVVSTFYRKTSVETKRLDSLMRSRAYASFQETLTGLATIRAYHAQEISIRSAEQGLDWENKAYYMTIAIQRWLAVRLDIFGSILILGISLFASGFRFTVNPSKIGVVLSYALTITQSFSDMISQFAQNEQNMNAVERVLVYTELPPEGDSDSHDASDDSESRRRDPPPPSWPEKGTIEFKNASLRYREGLPLVLKGVSFEVMKGEKVGIVGRTGAGKSSLLQALLRMVELSAGQVFIDGIDIRTIDLSTLRHRLALVPQDSTLFLGTLRENLDPLQTRTDAELISVLQRSWLLPQNGVVNPGAETKFSLDATVGDEGSNYSAGEKQLLSLARALAKNSRIIILDEATSSVDVETDAKLQRTIQTEFSDSTLLCIAHRLNTIAYYDRVLVMDRGEVAEFDTVLNLFDRETSIFRSLCDEARLTRADIVKIREMNEVVVSGGDLKEVQV